ncbi:hypothetical protein [Azospirillum sp. SYSU D00513]|uniref:hypothetical protein n=1 Tax=Azospirillum sp. SYSU D00513 TaxID=2812561 RepID=UPI001A977ECA|nr:hypothetical protein [Azospirillum sp. SYSU D00513]
MAVCYAVAVDSEGNTWAVVDVRIWDRSGGYRALYTGLTFEAASSLAKRLNWMHIEPPANNI